MTDTVRTRSELQTLLADNEHGDISAQDLRDYLVSVLPFTPLGGILVASSTAPTNVKSHADYVCDGTADEVQINSAITDAVANGGGDIFLTSGTFNLAASINIADPKIRLRGAGIRTTTLFLSNSANTRPIYIADNSALDGIALDSFTIDGNKNNQTDGADPNARAGIFVDGLAGGQVNDIIFSNLYVTNCRGMGIACDGQSGAKVIRPRFVNITAIANGHVSAAYAGDGIHVGFANDAFFQGVVGSFNTDTGVALDHTSGAVHMGTVAYSNASNGLTAARASDNIKFIGCTTDGASAGTFGIRTGKFGEGSAGLSTYVKIIGCQILNNVTTGLHIEDHSVMVVRDTVFSGNGAPVAFVGTTAFIVNAGGNVGWAGATGGGPVTISSGTSVTVNHNLGSSAVTPTAKNITVTATNNNGPLYVTGVTSTQFTVNGPTGSTFMWQARMDV